MPVKVVSATSPNDVGFHQFHDADRGRIEPEEAALDVAATGTIDIKEFVNLAEIDPVYFNRSYYLVPDEGGEKPYALLAETMAQTGKVAVGRFALRTKQHLATLRAKNGVLVLATMFDNDEVIPLEDLEVLTAAATAPTDREVAIAKQLVESWLAPFNPSKLIAQQEPSASTVVVDLMEALEASLAETRKHSA